MLKRIRTHHFGGSSTSREMWAAAGLMRPSCSSLGLYDSSYWCELMRGGRAVRALESRYEMKRRVRERVVGVMDDEDDEEGVEDMDVVVAAVTRGHQSLDGVTGHGGGYCGVTSCAGRRAEIRAPRHGSELGVAAREADDGRAEDGHEYPRARALHHTPCI